MTFETAKSTILPKLLAAAEEFDPTAGTPELAELAASQLLVYRSLNGGEDPDGGGVSSLGANFLAATDIKVGLGFLGGFGFGRYRVYRKPGTFSFIVPDGVTKVRARCVGAGGKSSNGGDGASGGGYVHGVVDVVPGQSITVTVPDYNAVANSQGGTASFGNLMSATGGMPNAGPGGEGIGGDFRAKGGRGGAEKGAGGGGAGSQLGDGGEGSLGGGGGVGAGDADVSGGGSPFSGANIFGRFPIQGGTEADSLSAVDLDDLAGIVLRFPFDSFFGAGGKTLYLAGSVPQGGNGGNGGGGGPKAIGGFGGGGGPGFSATYHQGGDGGLGGGGGGNLSSGTSANGGPGLVVVEW